MHVTEYAIYNIVSAVMKGAIGVQSAICIVSTSKMWIKIWLKWSRFSHYSVKAYVLLIGTRLYKRNLWINWIMFPICCNAPCKAWEYSVMPHIRHVCVLLPLVMPHVRHVYVLVPLLMPLVRHAHLGST